MCFFNKSISEIRKSLDNNDITVDELFNIIKKQALEDNKKYNMFEYISESFKYKKSDGILDGIPYVLKDNFSTKDIPTTASSNILNGYIPVYNATVYQKLEDSGAVLIGKTTMDELAMGGTGTTGHLGKTLNPWDVTRQIGGSSSGSAAAVACGLVPFAIGSDTGDSVRKPASYGGIIGFKPTYGLISRYGVFAFASSLDHVGVMAKNVYDIALVTNIIKGRDDLDMTSLKDDGKDYTKTLNEDIRGRKLFYFKDICNKDYYNDNNEEKEAILDKFHENLNELRNIGFIIDEVDFNVDLFKAMYPTYMVISCAEATSNNANLTGIPFGVRGEGSTGEEIMFDARTKGFSELIKRRFILGSYVLQKENQEKIFNQAKRVRRLIVNNMKELFKEYDGLIMPATGSIAPFFDVVKANLVQEELSIDDNLLIGNFGGYPSITIPNGIVNDMPIALNLTCNVFQDALILNMAKKIEEVVDFKGLMAGDKNV